VARATPAAQVEVVVRRGADLVRWLLDPLLRFNVLDRSLALGAQAFGALIPLMIVLETAQPGNASLADSLIERFHLGAAAAEAVRAAFATPTDQTTITVLSVALLVVSALSFTRRLQRLYEESWSLPPRGMRGTASGLGWLAVFALYVWLHPLLDDSIHGLLGLTLSIAGLFALGLFTPYLLLGRRVPPRRLLLQAALLALFMVLLAVWSAIYMPRAMGSSAAAYGAIGVAFALLTWLWGVGIVLVCSAVYGSPQMTWRRSAR
jgi:membrane protein